MRRAASLLMASSGFKSRVAIVGWTTLAVFPLEIAFDVIEESLGRRCVEL